MMNTIYYLSKFEFVRSKRFYFLGMFLPSFLLIFILLTGITLVFISVPDINNLNYTTSYRILLLRSFSWSIQLLIIFHAILFIPWLFSQKSIDIYLLSSLNNKILIVIGRLVAVIVQQLLLSSILVFLFLFYFILVFNIEFTPIAIFTLSFSIILGILLVNTVVLCLTLIIRTISTSIFTINSILSLYLLGLPLFMLVNISYGFIPNDLNVITILIQLQSINNALIQFDHFDVLSIDPFIFALIFIEFLVCIGLNLYYGKRYSI